MPADTEKSNRSNASTLSRVSKLIPVTVNKIGTNARQKRDSTVMRLGTMNPRKAGGSKLEQIFLSSGGAAGMTSVLKRMTINYDKAESGLSFITSVDGAGGPESSFMEITDEKMKQYMEKKIHQNQINFDMQVKNMKPIAMQIAVDFLKKESQFLANVLTRQHHNVIKTFLDYKERSEAVMKEREVIYKHWQLAERALC